MSPSPQLAPPGTSFYSSDTLNVGDGTWDSQRNTFLLPNLMGLNFETMRYNGMGNRFREMAGYHSLIAAHGVIAAITFLGIVPGAILIARFYSPSPYWARRIHIWMQVLTVLLSTVVFVLGWFAVGPKRSLTNPHHGIGLAIYVMIMAQTLWGWFIYGRLRDRRRPHIPLKLMLHHWLGRAIALLGIAQIPLGLTLYGSPQSLFILFALAAFALLLAYFVLAYVHERRIAADYDSRGRYSGPEVIDDRHPSNLGPGGGQFRRRSRSRSPTVDYSEGTSFVTEKEKPGWGKRLLQAGALVGAAAVAKKLFDKRRNKDSDTESGRYHPAHTVTDSMYDDSVSRIEQGRRPRTPPPHRRYDGPLSPEQTRYTESEFTRTDDGGGHGVRNALLGAGLFAGVRQFWKKRQDKKDQERIEEIRRAEMEHERMARAQSRRYTGDGHGHRRGGRYSPVTDVTGTTDLEAIHGRPGGRHEIPPIPASQVDELSGADTIASAERQHRRYPSTLGAGTGVAVGGAAAGPSSSHRRRSGGRDQSVDSQPVSIKVKMHDHGRRITLRQLTREEASAGRETRRRDRHRRSSRRRDGSLSGTEGEDHWRRVEEMERQQAEEMQREAERTPVPSTVAPHPGPAPGPSPIDPAGIPPPGPPPAMDTVSSPTGFTPLPPPPIPVGPGGINSPMSTDLSSYASRSGRRRAERRTQGRGGRQHSVEFT